MFHLEKPFKIEKDKKREKTHKKDFKAHLLEYLLHTTSITIIMVKNIPHLKCIALNTAKKYIHLITSNLTYLFFPGKCYGFSADAIDILCPAK